MKKKIICFGLGRIYQTFLALYDSSKAEIVALSDNDSVKWTSAGVIAPFKIKELEFDFIIITSAYYIEIKKQLCDMGILSIDLDGNDWWILNAIDCVSPRILICEYNNIFGAEKKVTIPYDAGFIRTKKHYSNLYWGCSIAALCVWAENNGYYYMGSNSAGNNAFFVRKDCIKPDKIPEKANIFIESKYRESRDEKGVLTYLRGSDRLKCIKSMQVFDIETGHMDTIENIYNI